MLFTPARRWARVWLRERFIFQETAAGVDGQRFEYVIDANDVIREVNEEWTRFAEENGTGGLPATVVGSWLWQHLGGLEVKHLYRTLLEQVRAKRKVVRVPFRCDAPEVRRHMMLEVIPLAEGGIRFSSWVEEAADRPKIGLLDPGLEHDPEHLLRMCAWCKRIDGGVDHWVELEDAFEEAELFHLEPFPQITHAVCSDCQDRIMTELEESG